MSTENKLNNICISTSESDCRLFHCTLKFYQRIIRVVLFTLEFCTKAFVSVEISCELELCGNIGLSSSLAGNAQKPRSTKEIIKIKLTKYYFVLKSLFRLYKQFLIFRCKFHKLKNIYLVDYHYQCAPSSMPVEI